MLKMNSGMPDASALDNAIKKARRRRNASARHLQAHRFSAQDGCIRVTVCMQVMQQTAEPAAAIIVPFGISVRLRRNPQRRLDDRCQAIE
jgi:hypothetical protein